MASNLFPFRSLFKDVMRAVWNGTKGSKSKAIKNFIKISLSHVLRFAKEFVLLWTEMKLILRQLFHLGDTIKWISSNESF